MDNCTNTTIKLFFMLQPNLTNLTPNALVIAAIKNTAKYVAPARSSTQTANIERQSHYL